MTKFKLSTFVCDQVSTQQPVLKADLAGKTVVVVGANTGLGFEASKHFASMNPGRLILACRNQQRGEKALEELKASTGYSTVELLLVDLSEFSSVTEFCRQWNGRLDILIMNAGISTTQYTEIEGWESSIKVNHLGTAFMTLLLLPHMKATAEVHGATPRIVIVSSGQHMFGVIPKALIDSEVPILQNLSSKEFSSSSAMSSRYPTSKLLNVFYMRALNEHVCQAPFPVIVNAVSPGYCYSELRRDLPPLAATMHRVAEKTVALTTEEGSRQLIFAALADEIDTRGEYVSFGKVKEVSDFVLSEAGKKCQERIWRETVDILSDVDPQIRTTVNAEF